MKHAPPFLARFRPSPESLINSGSLAKLIILAGILLLLPIAPVSAATITVGANCTFEQAWDSAFDDSAPTGSDCTAGSGADTIVLNADVVLTEQIFEGGGGTLTIDGKGHTISGDGTFALIGLWGAPTITFNDITFTGGAAENGNGGAFNPYGGAGTYTFNDCVFYNNRATIDSTGGNGGAIAAGSATTITINRCAFYNNRAQTGGAIYTTGTLTVNNSSFYNNRSVREGGAITVPHTDTSKPVNLRHVTMTNNRGGTNSGALQLSQANVAHVRNSILYGNTPRDCYVHSDQVAGFVGKLPNEQGNPSSFIGVSNCDFEQRNYGDQRNPQLAGPFNGFYIPRAGSPAIDFVACLAANVGGNIDQRGVTRPIGSQCDAGAIEHAGYTPPPPGGGGPGGSGGSGGGTGKIMTPAETCADLMKMAPAVEVSNAGGGTACQEVEPAGYGHPDLTAEKPGSVVDVWGEVTAGTQVCFQGTSGKIRYVDTSQMKRTITTLSSFVKGNMICATINGPGQVALVADGSAPGGSAPAAQEPEAQEAGQQQAAQPAPASQGLNGCMVKTQGTLNFRESPAGDRLEFTDPWGNANAGWLPAGVTLTAVERSGNWLKVDYYGTQGWISAAYVTTSGSCG